jgi:DNA-binding transcriptional ArsR family regulator
MDALARAIADPIRREILLLLRERPALAGAIGEAFMVSRPAVSRHLRVLREAGLVRDEARGRVREYHLVAEPLAELEAFARELRRPAQRWERRFDALQTEVQRVRRKKSRSANTLSSKARRHSA